MKLRLLPLLMLLFAITAPVVSAQETPRIVASTSILADVAQNIAGELLTIETLVPVGADTHAFEPAPGDVVRIAEADMLLIVGAGYEGFLGNLLENAGSEAAEVVVVSNGVEILGYSHAEHHEEEVEAAEEHEHEHMAGVGPHLGVLGQSVECEAHEHEEEGEHSAEEEHADEHEHGACDPHVWLNPLNVITWARNIADAFSALDAANADTYQANADAYIAQLEALDEEIRTLVDTLPEERRVLVTNHEFMGYFADAYGFEVVGTVLAGTTTDSEPDPRQLAELVALIQSEGVPAVFAETTANAQLAEVVVQETGIDVVTTLYSESLSEADEPASTYLDYLRYNAQVIVEALMP